MRLHRLLSLCAIALLAAAAPTANAAAGDPATPDIQHVWIIVLENKDYADTFGPDTEAPYLAHELTRVGQLLPNYFGTSHASLGNYITMVSGQAPNADTQADCQVFKDVFPGVIAPDGQAVGQGCVYPKEVQTVANQLDEKGLKWRGYMEDMGNSPDAPKTCRHPAIGAQDDTQSAKPHDQYAARHNPFVYFHSVIDSPTCDANDVPLEQLAQDVKSPSTTPNYAFITPDLCNDGHDETCADGGPGGLQAADAFLRRWVPTITGSPGFAQHGMLIVTWDEANMSSTDACCDQQTGPNTPSPGVSGPGGGRTGTVLISPFVKPGSVNPTEYNHYGLLRSVENIFGLGHLGYAGRDGLKSFGADVFNATAAPKPPPPTHTACKAAKSGKAVAGLRLRDRLLTFRGRRTTRIRLTARTHGHKRRLRKPRRVVACHDYSLKVPKGTTSVTLRAAGRTQRVRRGPSGQHG
jgi:hypothetical protein